VLGDDGHPERIIYLCSILSVVERTSRRLNGEASRSLRSASNGSLGERRPLAEEVADHLRGLILSGQLAAGEFLRLERVAQDLNVSVTPAREALLALQGDGLVTLEPNRGFRVVALRRSDIEDVYWMHEQIAGELAARAAMRLDPETLEEIEGTQSLLVDATARGATVELMELNFGFHRLINAAAAAPKLSWFLSTTLRYMPSTNYGTIEGWPEASNDDHDVVISALRSRDPERARLAMRYHVRHSADLLVAHLDAQGHWLREPDQRYA
jgi:DNA-binding GntR family transcriptional regulator